MKPYFKILIALFILTTQDTLLSAQTPQAFSYQAVARNNDGSPMANKTFIVLFNILNDSAGGPIVYREEQRVTTNEFGLFTADIGTSSISAGSFNDIDWSSGGKYLQVEIDTNGVGAFADMGTAQLLSVPYALYAGNAKLSLPYVGSIDTIVNAIAIDNNSGSAFQGISSAQYLGAIYGSNGNSKGYGIWGNTTSGIGVYGTANDINGVAVSAMATGISKYALSADASQSSSAVAAIFTANSAISKPTVWLNESDNDYARLSFSNNTGSTFWTIAGYNSSTNTTERLNFYNSTTGDVMDLTGDGKIGIGTANPTEKVEIVNGNLKITNGGIKDANNSLGVNGATLTSTGAGVKWVDNTVTFQVSNAASHTMLPAGSTNTYQTVNFTNVYINQGNAIDTATDIFRVPSDGIYLISLSYRTLLAPYDYTAVTVYSLGNGRSLTSFSPGQTETVIASLIQGEQLEVLAYEAADPLELGITWSVTKLH